MDAVYYNQLTSECSTITHSGDQRDGTHDGYDELISINTTNINFGITYLPILINAYNANFSQVETATVTFLQDGKIVTEILLGGIKSENSACLAGILYRSNGGWKIYNSQECGPGKNFKECEKLIEDNLIHVGLDPIIMMESKNWNGKTNKKFNLKKDDSLCLPSGNDHLTLGLGWDTKLDLDASIIMLDGNGRLVDKVFYN